MKSSAQPAPAPLTYIKKTIDSFPWKDIDSGLKVCSVNVTPTLAKDLLVLNEKNRKMSTDTIKQYASDMKNKQWGHNASPINISNTYRLLDGQHRLAAVIQSGATIPFVFYYGQNNSDFQYIDGGRKRTAADILGMSGYKNACTLSGVGFLMLQHEIDVVGQSKMTFSRNAKTVCAQIWDVELQKSITWANVTQQEFKIKNSGVVFAHFCIMNGKLKDKGKEFIDLFTQFLQGNISISDLPGGEQHAVVLLKKKLKTYMGKHLSDSHPNRVMEGVNMMEAFMNYVHNKPFKRFVCEKWPTQDEIGAFRVK